MYKLIQLYRLNPSYKNAQKVRAYERTHPMSVTMLSDEDADMVATAIHHANVGPNHPAHDL